MLNSALIIALLWTAVSQDASRAAIKIINTGPPAPYVVTKVDGGPSMGDILNNHYFPGVNQYNAGQYIRAEAEFTYVIDRPSYLDPNPNKQAFLSTSRYLRGMIYLYHATGLGRHALARTDLEASIEHNPNNHLAYLELSRIYSTLGFTEQAKMLLEQLTGWSLDEKVKEAVQRELSELEQRKPGQPDPVTQTAEIKPIRDVVPAPQPELRPQPDKGRSTGVGRLAVNSMVATDVYVEGKNVGSTPLTLELSEGTHTVEYRHEGLSKTMTHKIGANQLVSVTVEFDFLVDINAQPWAEVILEGSGVSLGQTPLGQVRVELGSSLIFRNPSFPEKLYKITNTKRVITVVLE